MLFTVYRFENFFLDWFGNTATFYFFWFAKSFHINVGRDDRNHKALLFYKPDNSTSICTTNLSLLHGKMYEAKASESQQFLKFKGIWLF